MPRQRTPTAPAQLLLLILFIAACSPAAPVLGPHPAGTPAADYDDALATWTRKARDYRNFESRIITAATYLSPRFIEAMAAEHQRIFSPTGSEQASWLKGHTDETARSEVFFVAVSTRDRGWNDLEQPDSIWRLYLETDRGDKVSPERIVAIRGQPPVLAHFFPHLGHFSIGYWVVFPRYPVYRDGEGLPRPVIDPSVSWFRLRMRSPVASVDLTWKLEG
ncbi:MAG: hypothetical protein ABIK09_20190 [Pseudomonadota bacterium]